jgi:quinol monooxygenase YgiN
MTVVFGGATIIFLAPMTHGAPRVHGGKVMTQSNEIREATFIPFKANPDKDAAVAGLLGGAATLVHQTEPQTLQWLALREGEGKFAIIDFFRDEQGRAAHFAGKVAATLKGAAPEAVAGGWEAGVVANVENSKVIGATVTADRKHTAKFAVRIDLQANPGKEEELAAFLSGGAALVHETEPGTLLWYALRLDNARFVIFDVFASEEGKAAHFAGKVAAALKGKAPELVRGGWDKGVVANVRSFAVLSATY